jgi:hypothetical protein
MSIFLFSYRPNGTFEFDVQYAWHKDALAFLEKHQRMPSIEENSPTKDSVKATEAPALVIRTSSRRVTSGFPESFVALP